MVKLAAIVSCLIGIRFEFPPKMAPEKRPTGYISLISSSLADQLKFQNPVLVWLKNSSAIGFGSIEYR